MYSMYLPAQLRDCTAEWQMFISTVMEKYQQQDSQHYIKDTNALNPVHEKLAEYGAVFLELPRDGKTIMYNSVYTARYEVQFPSHDEYLHFNLTWG